MSGYRGTDDSWSVDAGDIRQDLASMTLKPNSVGTAFIPINLISSQEYIT